MALGKAFIEVHADTKPFAQELGRELGRILKAVENGPARKTGERLGKDLGEGASDGFAKAFKISPGTGGSGGGGGGSGGGSGGGGGGLGNVLPDTSGFLARMGKGLVDALDDGLSGLPAELKLALAAALLAAAPVVAGFGGALGAAIVTSFVTVLGAGLSVAVASQLVGIQDEWKSTLRFLSQLSVEWAQPVVGPLLSAFQLIRDRAVSMGPEITRFFELGARAIVPLTSGILDLVENALPFINSAMTNIDTFANIIANGFGEIGTAFGEAIDNIANDDDAVAALNDIMVLVVDLIRFGGGVLKLFLDIYGAIRAAGEALDVFGIADWTLRLADGVRQTDLFDGSMQGLMKTTQLEVEALEELNQEMDEYIRQLDAAWSADINFEQSLDDLTDSLRENGRTLDINTQKGRDNQSALKDSALDLIEQRKQTILLTGDVEGANRTFEINRQRLIDAAAAGGITRQEFDKLTGAILAVPPPVVTGVSESTLVNLGKAGALAGAAADAIGRLAKAATGMSSISVPPPYYGQGRGGMQQYANGGIFNRPTVGMFGEAGEEVIIPTTRPGRAAELISQSPMLSSMMSPNINVYIGDRQIDAYIDSRVARSQAAIARGLSYGSRSL